MLFKGSTILLLSTLMFSSIEALAIPDDDPKAESEDRLRKSFLSEPSKLKKRWEKRWDDEFYEDTMSEWELVAVINDDVSYNSMDWTAFLEANEDLEVVQIFSSFRQIAYWYTSDYPVATAAYKSIMTMVPWSSRLEAEAKYAHTATDYYGYLYNTQDYYHILTGDTSSYSIGPVTAEGEDRAQCCSRSAVSTAGSSRTTRRTTSLSFSEESVSSASDESSSTVSSSSSSGMGEGLVYQPYSIVAALAVGLVFLM